MGTPGKQLSEQEQDRIRRLSAKLSVREIAKEERLSPTTVQKILKMSVDK